MKRHFLHVAEDCEQPTQKPAIERRVRMAAEIDLDTLEHHRGVRGMQRFDQGVLSYRDVGVVVALNCLVQERKANENDKCERQQKPARIRYAGFHRNTGLRAAATSSTRLVRVP